jgi:hypothetical protein
VLLIVPFAGAPATLQVTAIFEVPETIAENWTLFATATLALAGVTETVTGVLCVAVPAQPSSKLEMQVKPTANVAWRMQKS